MSALPLNPHPQNDPRLSPSRSPGSTTLASMFAGALAQTRTDSRKRKGHR